MSDRAQLPHGWKPPSGFRNWITFEPGYDCIDIKPCVFGSDACTQSNGRGSSHGRHGVNMRWLLAGELGVVQFLVYTPWMPEGSTSTYREVLPADVGYHSPRPLWDGQDSMSCDLLPGGVCFYDGSGLMAAEPWRILRERGSDAVWDYLLAYYSDTFSTVTTSAGDDRNTGGDQ